MTNRLHPSVIVAAFLALTLGVLMLWIGGQTGMSTDFWAFSHLRYVPIWLRYLAVALLLVTPFVSAMGSGRSSEGWPPLLLRVPLWPIALLSGILFGLLREQTYHGDALLKLELLATESLATDPYVWKEPLDAFLAHTTSSLVVSIGQPPETAVALLSILAGVLFVWSALYLARLLGRSAWTGAVILVALLATGSSQLWFGHIENYSLVTAVSFYATALAIGTLRGGLPLWPVGLAAGAALSLHPQAAFTLPALLLLLERERWPRQIAVLFLTGLIVPLLTTSLLILVGGVTLPWVAPLAGEGYGGDTQLFWTFSQALAPHRLWQALNNLWLLVPLFPFWLIAGLWALVDRQTRRDRVLRYLAVLTAGLLFYFFAFQNDLPRWRDWDLYAIAGPAFTLWGVYAWLELMAVSDRRHDWMWPFLTTGLVFASLIVAAWIGVNARNTLIRPTSEERVHYRQRYQVADLTDLLAQATVTPSEPICSDEDGCERVDSTDFIMPQDGDTRPVIFAHAPARIAMPLDVPASDSFLWLSPALDPESWDWGGDGVTFSVAVEREGGDDLLWSGHYTPDDPLHRDWQEVFVPLIHYRGQSIVLVLATSPGPEGNDAGDRAGWGMPWLMRGVLDERFDSDLAR